MSFYDYLDKDQQIKYLAREKRKYQRNLRKELLAKRIALFKSNAVPAAKLSTAYVYIISNDSFPGWYKIGTCVDITKRLQTYQTSDPHKNYRIIESWITTNRFLVESAFLGYAARSSIFEVKGEWVFTTDYNILKNKFVPFVGMTQKKLCKEIELHNKYKQNLGCLKPIQE